MGRKLNLIGHLGAELGVGESARRLGRLMQAAGYSVNKLNFSASKSRQLDRDLIDENSFDAGLDTISVVNPDQLGALIAKFGLGVQERRTHVGFWSWELPRLPKSFALTSNLLDEVWTVSTFAQQSIDRATSIPANYVRLPVPIPRLKTPLSRRYFGLDDDVFLVLCSFDFQSDFRRKNPDAAINAFIQAFEPSDRACLVVKTINGERHREQLQVLHSMAQARPDIKIMDGYLDHYSNQALIELADVFLSLHRSEGYGINLVDAMARFTPVIATGYSGNLDYMDETTGVLVPYDLVPVKSYAGVRVNSEWANPDVNYASEALLRLKNDKNLVTKLASRARLTIEKEHSLASAAKRFRDKAVA